MRIFEFDTAEDREAPRGGAVAVDGAARAGAPTDTPAPETEVTTLAA